MGQVELLRVISTFLDTHKIPYMITGAWSAIFYGRPRASHDIDFVVEIPKKEVKRVLKALEALTGEFLVQTESIKEAVKYKSMFNIIHLPTVLKLDFWILTSGKFDQSRFKRRKKVKILDQFMKMATAEDTILQKLIWYKMGEIEKHLVDAAFVYQIQKKNLNFNYLNNWVKKLGIEENYQKLKKIDLEQYL
ncbi:hypothetical protein A3I48_00335 [Candidatus Daviesbacteria bacterium RIFCSPLOWO2_02_FULL_36_7]|uniref:Uncharacterized protein n=1 Tax=Candidatus Daviesbacteria bacterium RIFCSPLOWO2_02_FULL_36_7 TaxID=1797792 RepID=A0A1F5MI39_9BACT|nr:MAG: hypothetical protein A3I48_00335 [Candidatus Daviesbacteria bacterium RIFCSPLOWO2_02_FULL_36_7]